MNKFRVVVKNIDESLVYNCLGDFKNDGFYLDKFNFIFKGHDSMLIENTIPLKNRIPLKKGHLFPFKYKSAYGEMMMQSKLLSLEYSECRMEVEYELYQANNIIGKYKITLEPR